MMSLCHNNPHQSQLRTLHRQCTWQNLRLHIPASQEKPQSRNRAGLHHLYSHQNLNQDFGKSYRHWNILHIQNLLQSNKLIFPFHLPPGFSMRFPLCPCSFSLLQTVHCQPRHLLFPWLLSDLGLQSCCYPESTYNHLKQFSGQFR